MLKNRFCVGSPVVVHPDQIKNNCKKFGVTDMNEYFGIVKLTIIPPRGLKLPVLPYRARNGKLTFGLCRKCIENNNQGICRHNKDERKFVGCFCTFEVSLALEMGYIVEKIHMVYHWPESSDGVFKEYVKFFYKGKVESSRAPKDMDLDEFIKQSLIKDEVALETDKLLNPNKEIRPWFKLTLNTLWGKFCQNNDKTEIQWIDSYDQLARLLSSPETSVTQLEFSHGQMAMVGSKTRSDCRSSSHQMHNPIIGSMVTSYARCHLYKTMRKLGDRLFYVDTDSCVFLTKPGDWIPELGNFLGEFTDELNGDYGVLWCCLGPKSYTMVTKNGKEITKCKGFVSKGVCGDILNSTLMKAVLLKDLDGVLDNYKNVKDAELREMLIKLTREENNANSKSVPVVFFPENNFVRQKPTAVIKTVNSVKKLKFTVDKCRVLPDFSTLPFGY